MEALDGKQTEVKTEVSPLVNTKQSCPLQIIPRLTRPQLSCGTLAPGQVWSEGRSRTCWAGGTKRIPGKWVMWKWLHPGSRHPMMVRRKTKQNKPQMSYTWEASPYHVRWKWNERRQRKENVSSIHQIGGTWGIVCWLGFVKRTQFRATLERGIAPMGNCMG